MGMVTKDIGDGIIVAVDEDTLEAIRQANILRHTAELSDKMLKQQREEFNSWGAPWRE